MLGLRLPDLGCSYTAPFLWKGEPRSSHSVPLPSQLLVAVDVRISHSVVLASHSVPLPSQLLVAEDARNSHSVVLASQDAVEEDARGFKSQYESEVQRVLSRVQHHWHNTDEDGNDVPMKYCRLRRQMKKSCTCKVGFPL